MEREREDQLYRLQADLRQVLAEPTRLKLLSLLGERPRAVKDLVVATGERQAKISQRGIVRTQHVGTEVHEKFKDYTAYWKERTALCGDEYDEMRVAGSTSCPIVPDPMLVCSLPF